MRARPLLSVLLLAALPGLLLLSLLLGAGPGLSDSAAALLHHSDSAGTLLALRLPRTLAALLVGSALATAGSLLQALTRNPLAEPGLLGVNAGAAL
uniref:iron chelate uptake ABC transporter family permease subunit n=1 Tax=Chitinimonas sp. TaxID=1934313 RepID=UPI0035B1EF7F